MISYLLNLPHRTDRLQHSLTELAKVGVNPVILPAFSGPNRPLAFNKSQYEALRLGLLSGAPRFAIFEDDVTFTDDWPKIADAITELPEDFDVLHLGCNIVGMSTTQWQMPTKYSDHLCVLHNAWCTQAVIWNRHAAIKVLRDFVYHSDDYIKEGLCIFDEWLRLNLYTLGRSFVMKPMVAYQKPDFSDLQQAQSDYTHSFTEGNKYLNGL